MKLLPAAVALAFVGLALPATATPMPNMVAQASLQTDGVAVVWTAPDAIIDSYVVERSHAGGPFTPIATLGDDVNSFLDAVGEVSDVYLVKALDKTNAVAFTSNPTPVLLLLGCPWVTSDTPPDVNCECFPCP